MKLSYSCPADRRRFTVEESALSEQLKVCNVYITNCTKFARFIDTENFINLIIETRDSISIVVNVDVTCP